MGIPRSVTENGWPGLPAGESSLELELELGVRGGSRPVPSWQRGAGGT